jgi:hypothetical protein
MSQNVSPQLLAGGNLNVMSFVKMSTAADNTALQAGANERIIGITEAGPQDAPGTSGATAYAAAAGQITTVYGLGNIVNLVAGSGGWTRGDQLISDGSGHGVTAAATGTTVQWVGAIALENAAAGEAGRVQIVLYPFRPALT